MSKQKHLMTYANIGLVTTLLLCLLLVGFLSIWVAYGSAANVMSQVGLQRARVERLTKDVLLLADHPTLTEETQAVSEMQNTLPGWQQTQAGLQTGDATLGLPRHPAPDILLQLAQVQPDYTALLVAMSAILVRPAPVNPIEVQIVKDHERAYFLGMSIVNMLWQQHVDDIFWQLFWIETTHVLAIALLVVLMFLFVTRRAIKIHEKDSIV